ncbi:MAG: acyl-CoA dehydrogenase family protein, partial [Actinomycetota bacterium]
MLAGGSGVARAARAKLLGAELCQQIPRFGLEVLGSGGVVDDHELAFLWRQSILETIAGGTVEIMLSLLAREELGLGSGR